MIKSPYISNITKLTNVCQVYVDLVGNGSHAMLNELAVYVREDPEAQSQTPYDNAQGSAWLTDNTTAYQVQQVGNSCC